MFCLDPEPLFTKWQKLLFPNVVNFRCREIICHINRTPLKCVRHFGGTAAEEPV